ncbi:MAG: YfhO family protein, partial [Acetatifactor sp.]|nr:YfhO family protein [Acetatifactor sp.]
MLALAALFVSNYYIGYMAGIFTGLYFLYRLTC